MDRDSETRSSLLYQVERILHECKEDDCLPEVLVMENVTQVHGTNNIENWRGWLLELERLGYSSYWQDMIATDYGIPQIRDRTFCVSILGEYSYKFPQPIELEKRLKDLLEENVEEKYFLSNKGVEYVMSGLEKHFTSLNEDRSITLTAKGTNNYTGQFIAEKKEYFQIKNPHGYMNGEIKKTDRISTIDSGLTKWHLLIGEQTIKIKSATKQGYMEATEGDGIDISTRPQNHRGTVQKGKAQTDQAGAVGGVVVGVAQRGRGDRNEQQLEFRNEETSNSLTTAPKDSMVAFGENECQLRIRKLTPKECFRLQGVKDDDINKLDDISDSTKCHLAGDSICTTVLMALFGELCGKEWKEKVRRLH